MSEKERTSINLRADHKEWLDKNGYNRSKLFNKLLDEYRSGEFGMETAIAQYRKQQIEAEIESLEKQLEIKQEERRDIEENRTTQDEKDEQHWKDAVSNIRPSTNLRELNGMPDPEDWKPPVDNKKVQIYADRLGIEPEKFVEKFPQKRREYDAI